MAGWSDIYVITGSPKRNLQQRKIGEAYLLLMTGPALAFTQLALRIWMPAAQGAVPFQWLVRLRSKETFLTQGPQAEVSQ